MSSKRKLPKQKSQIFITGKPGVGKNFGAIAAAIRAQQTGEKFIWLDPKR